MQPPAQAVGSGHTCTIGRMVWRGGRRVHAASHSSSARKPLGMHEMLAHTARGTALQQMQYTIRYCIGEPVPVPVHEKTTDFYMINQCNIRYCHKLFPRSFGGLTLEGGASRTQTGGGARAQVPNGPPSRLPPHQPPRQPPAQRRRRAAAALHATAAWAAAGTA